jgi:hypothetical protein
MNIILLASNTALALACAGCLLACSRIRNKPAYLVAIYILSYADIVIVLELAGILRAIRPVPVLALQLSLTAVCVLVWLRMGRPPLLGPFTGLRIPRISVRGLFNLVRRSPLLAGLLILLGGGVVYVYFLHAELNLVMPPSNWDSLTYHLSRVGFWLQYKSFYPWPTPNNRQTTYPMNAELGLLWTILWWGTDQLTGFIQWSTIPVIMAGIYGLARLLDGSRTAGWLTALLWATLPQVLYQSHSTQNDLVTAAFWVTTIFFLFAGLREKQSAHFYLSGISFGLAMGTKKTSFLVLPGLALAILLVLLLYFKQPTFKSSATRWITACTLGFLLLGSYSYVQNTIAFGRPLVPLNYNPGAPTQTPISTGTNTAAGDLRFLADNMGRYIYQLVDFSPLPLGIPKLINPVKAAFFSALFRVLHVDLQNPATIGDPTVSGTPATFGLDYINPLDENRSWFGPLAALLVLAVVYHAYRAARTRDALKASLAVIGIVFLAAASLARGWDSGTGRYFIIPVALCFPLLAGFLETHTLGRSILASFLVALGLVALFTITTRNDDLQNLTPYAIFPAARRAPASAKEFDYRMVMENVPENVSIGVVHGWDFRDYPFFGEHFTRRVILAIPDDRSNAPRVDTARFASDFQHSDYLYIEGTESHFIPDLATQAFDVLSVHNILGQNSNTLWVRRDLHAPNACDDKKWPFTDFFRSAFPRVCARFPIVPPVLTDTYWTLLLEHGRFVPVIGVGPHAALEFSLLVKEPTRARFMVEVSPRSKDSQTVQLVLSTEGSKPILLSAPFDAWKVLEFRVRLEAGLYRVRVGLVSGQKASIVSFRVRGP